MYVYFEILETTLERTTTFRPKMMVTAALQTIQVEDFDNDSGEVDSMWN